MGTFRLKRITFSEKDKQQDRGMSLGKKLAIAGGLSLAGLTAASIYCLKKGNKISKEIKEAPNKIKDEMNRHNNKIKDIEQKKKEIIDELEKDKRFQNIVNEYLPSENQIKNIKELDEFMSS